MQHLLRLPRPPSISPPPPVTPHYVVWVFKSRRQQCGATYFQCPACGFTQHLSDDLTNLILRRHVAEHHIHFRLYSAVAMPACASLAPSLTALRSNQSFPDLYDTDLTDAGLHKLKQEALASQPPPANRWAGEDTFTAVELTVANNVEKGARYFCAHCDLRIKPPEAGSGFLTLAAFKIHCRDWHLLVERRVTVHAVDGEDVPAHLVRDLLPHHDRSGLRVM